MKKIDLKLIMVVAILAFFTSVNVNAGFRHHFRGHSSGCKTVGAPLDGGLLTALLGAGAVYFVARKKKREE